jgi:regulator of sigma E protease
MDSAIWVIEVILAFSFMIAIHEGGHYFLCRFFKVDVEEFALGFGPTLFARKWGKTLYSLRAIPLGGFCKPQGGDLSGQSAEEMYAQAPKPGDFLFASWWKRVFIFLAGPGMNLLSAFVILFLLFWIVGDKAPMEKPVLGYVTPNSVAQAAGLKKGDRLVQVEGQVYVNLVRAREAVYEKMLKSPDSGVLLVLERSGKTFERVVKGDLKDPKFDLGLYSSIPPVIGSVPFSSPARKAGLREGDVVLGVNGKKVTEWTELTYLIRNSPTDEIKLDIGRGGKSHPVALKKVYDGLGKHIGISPADAAEYDVQSISASDAFVGAGRKIVETTVLYVTTLGKMFTGKVSLKDTIGGPVTIMRFMYQRASKGWVDFFNIVAFISLILCIMNLLPIPVVDGGQIVLCVVEGIKRGPVPVKIQMVYQQVGFILVLGLMGLAIFMDFWSYFLEKFRSQIH